MLGLVFLLAVAALAVAFVSLRRGNAQASRIAELERQLLALWELRNARRPQAEAPNSAGLESPSPEALAPEPQSPAALAAEIAQADATTAAPGDSGQGSRSGIPAVPRRPESLDRPASEAIGPSRVELIFEWLRVNWIYPLAAAALVLSGLYLVQYAVEHSVLGPRARIGLALLTALALMLGGEWLRRRPAAGQVLPATLAGAGIVVAMTAVLAALRVFALIDATTGFGVLAALAFFALLLGLLHGPFLTVLGVFAGSLCPFILGGGGHPIELVLVHFVLLALLAQALSGLRKWSWTPWAAVLAPMLAIILWRLGGTDPLAMSMALVVVAFGAMTLPFGFGQPVVEGPRALGTRLYGAPDGRPRNGVTASFVATTIAVLGITAFATRELVGTPLALLALALLVAIWGRRAPALKDQLILPMLGFPLWTFLAADASVTSFARAMTGALEPDTGPFPVVIVVVLAAIAACAYLWRGEAEAEDGAKRGEESAAAPAPVSGPAVWLVAALALSGGTLAVLETIGSRALGIPGFTWAMIVLLHAAGAVALALYYARVDQAAGRSNERLGIAACAAFALMALAMTILFGNTALTLALAVLLVAAAALERRLDVQALGIFQLAAALALLWRLVIVPGDTWYLRLAGDFEFFVSVIVSVAAPLAALWLTRDLPTTRLRAFCRDMLLAWWNVLALLASSLVIRRWLPGWVSLPAIYGLQASMFILLLAAQWQMARHIGMSWLRWLVVGGLGLCAVLLLGNNLLVVNPALNPYAGTIAGGPLVNDLILGYLLPGVVLLSLAWRYHAGRALFGAAKAEGPRDVRALAGEACGLSGLLMVMVWLFLAIRFFWQGPARMALQFGYLEGELYTYTFTLLLLGAGVMLAALRFSSSWLRRIALGLIGLAAAKAFLVDASELTGLLRAGAFLGLGLSLAGLAWLNGWVAAQEVQARRAPNPPPS